MALEDIIKTILEEAQKQAKEIKEKSLKKVREIEEEGKKRVKKEEERIDIQAKAEQKQIFQEAQIKARLFSKNAILAKKQELINQIFALALDRLKNLPENEEIELLVYLLKQVPKLEGQVQALPAKGKEKILNQAIKKAKRDFFLSKESIKAAGGFVLKSKDIEIDSSYETLLKEKRELVETKLAQILFK